MIADGEQYRAVLLRVIFPHKDDAVAVVDREAVASTEVSLQCMYAQAGMIILILEKLDLFERFLLQGPFEFLELPSEVRGEMNGYHTRG